MEGKVMNQTEQIILENLGRQDTVFVFSTGLAAQMWAERMLDHVPAVAMERFVAWDSFKSEAVRSRQQDKASIPAMMRKIFASHLIQENARKVTQGEKSLFSSLINPKYAQEAQSFTNWIAGLLPSLESWRRSHEKALESQSQEGKPINLPVLDQQDLDLKTLHGLYKDFLEENHRFDPAWEQPPFEDDGRHYIIFYPEILTDFSEYRHILESSNHIKLISCHTDNTKAPRCIRYDNARQEMRETALFIRNLVESGQCQYRDIYVSVPDMETMAPYLQREFQLYAIPAVFRTGKPLSAYGAGAIFAQIQGCLTSDFSFDSLKELLLNHHLPWRERELNHQLIQFGIKYNCLCSYSESHQDDTTQESPQRGGRKFIIDPWKEAFKRNPQEERLHGLYNSLRKAAQRFSQATSFEKLREAYFQFRDSFWDMSQVNPQADLVLGRCITELAGLMDLEREFPQLPVPNPFNFFLQVLEEQEYLAQSADQGVWVVPYRLVSSAPAGCHIVVGASQKDITHLFQQLGFLSQAKRNRLGLTDSNPSNCFIQLYQLHSRLPVRFSVAENNLSGYSIPHNGLDAIPRKKVSLLEATGSAIPLQQDFIMQERNLFQLVRNGGSSATSLQTASFTPTAIQQEGFHHWKSRLEVSDSLQQGTSSTDNSSQANPPQANSSFPHWGDKIQQALFYSNGLNISESHLNDFFICPRHWYFKRILRLEEPDTQAQLMQDAWMGTIYHDIIQLYLEPMKQCGTPLIPPQVQELMGESLIPEEQQRLEKAMDKVLSQQYKLSPLTQDLLLAQRNQILDTASSFMVALCKTFPHHQVVSLEESLSCQPQQLLPLLEKLADQEIQLPGADFPSSAEQRKEFIRQLEGFVLTGRLDCLLASPNDDLILLDFKLGNAPQLKEAHLDQEGRLANFQMAFYIILYESCYPERTIDSGAFMTIKDGAVSVIFGFDDNKRPQRNQGIITKDGEKGFTFNHTVAAALRDTSKFATALTSCTFPQMTGVNYETCSSCSWRRICRTTYTVGRDEV